jgi:hypothetical protein
MSIKVGLFGSNNFGRKGHILPDIAGSSCGNRYFNPCFLKVYAKEQLGYDYMDIMGYIWG